jgi:cellulose synthase (UDP-forming)
LSPDHPVRLGTLVDRADLQASGFAPGPIRIPVRTAPDIYTWRSGGIPVDISFRAPVGPIVDVATSRLDVSLSDTYLRSFPLGQEHWWPIEWILSQWGLQTASRTGRVVLPPYLMLGQEELQLSFDMRPLSRGECVAVPGDIKASIDPDSTIDISHVYRFARMPNLGLFASAGFPFTRLADLSGTAAVLPDHPTTVEAGAFLNLVGRLSAITGVPATGLQIISSSALQTVAGRDLLVVGALGRVPAFQTLLRDGPLQVSGNRLMLTLPGPLQDVRALLFDAPSGGERTRASLALDDSGDGMGVLLGLESTLTSGRSVVAVTGMTPSAVAASVAGLRDHDTSARIQGDVTLLQGDQVSAFRTSSGYDVGSLPLWLWAQHWFGDRPLRVAALLVTCACLTGIPLFWILRRRAAVRLRARTPKTL